MEVLQYAFMQRAFIGGVLIAALCSSIGVFLVLRRMSLLGDGLAHISFGGIAAGLFFKIYPLVSALAFSVLAAIGIQKLRQRKVQGDAAIAILFSFGLALGVIFISMGGFGTDIMSYLFGSVLAISDTDIYVIIAVSAAAFLALALFYKELLYASFDEEAARASGVPVGKLNYLLLVLAAVAVVVSLKIVGALLVSSFIAIPASIALRLSSSFKQAIAISVLTSIISVIAGLYGAYYLNLAAGGAIVMVLIALFLATLAYTHAKGKATFG